MVNLYLLDLSSPVGHRSRWFEELKGKWKCPKAERTIFHVTN